MNLRKTIKGSHWNQDENITEFSSGLKAAVQMSTLGIHASAFKPITKTYLERNYAKYFITL